ncbi:hypothetical protein [Methylobacterium sp. Gmos1]
MAGGVTSGIIYPGAVVEIAKRYSFHAIGGTSVGAIAAAVTAAAELGRRTGNPDAFRVVGDIPVALGEKAPDGRSRLFHLFAPEPETRGLMGLLTAVFAARGSLDRVRSVLEAALRTPAIGLPTAVAFFVGSWLALQLGRDGHLFGALSAVVADLALTIVTLIAAFGLVVWRRWLPAWRTNGYGVCTGKASPNAGTKAWRDFEGLTPWLHASVQAAAGRAPDERPVTFGDLWNAPLPDGSRPNDTVTAFTPRSIELAMIASDISRNRTVQLPFIETPSPLYIESETLRRYFPDAIANWIIEHPGAPDAKVEPRDGCVRLPVPQNIPIAFAARLSLSFPVLLCAVPLLTPDYDAPRTADKRVPLRRVWFSDGGLTSNFPVHFFDRPMPAHPTFCLNLVDFDTRVDREPETAGGEPVAEVAAGAPERGHGKPIAEARAEARRASSRPAASEPRDPSPGADVWKFVTMAQGNRARPVPFTAFDEAPGTGLGPFLKTLVNTARFWSDNQLLVAPGIRDRVVHIALREDEGGLNLDMDAKVIADLDRRGRAAGAKIAARFDPTATADPETGDPVDRAFPRHRWVRFRTFMAAVEDLSRRFSVSLRMSAQAAAGRNEPSLDDMIMGKVTGVGYDPYDRARDYYSRATDLFDRFARDLAAETGQDPHRTFDEPRRPDMSLPRRGPAPRPKMSLKLRPHVDADPRAETADLPAVSGNPVAAAAPPGPSA